MKKLILMLFVFSAAYSQNGRIYLSGSTSERFATASTTYANSQLDTVIWDREAGVSGVSFFAHTKDSVRFSNDSGCVILRVINGTMLVKAAADTLNFSSKVSTIDGNSSTLNFQDGVVFGGTPTYAPYADRIVFIVKYGVAGNGTTSPTVVYRLNKIYAK